MHGNGGTLPHRKDPENVVAVTSQPGVTANLRPWESPRGEHDPSVPIMHTHPLLCCCIGVCVGPVAAVEAIMRGCVNMYIGCFIFASLCVPALSWWDRLELCLELFREGCILFALALSFCLPGMAACAVRDMDEEREWTYHPIPTVCGTAHADRANAITCCFPNIRTVHSQYQDSCLPTGEDCIGCCCLPRVPACCIRCCPYNTAYPESAFATNALPSPRGSPETMRNSNIADVTVERSPGALRRHSFTMR